MSHWLTDFFNRIRQASVTQEDFQRVVARLLDHGVISRPDSKAEQELYDALYRIDDVVEEYLSVLGFRLYHNREHDYYRLYPPGANPPVLPEDEQQHVPYTQQLRVDQVALALTLRLLYSQKLTQGDINDQAEATTTFEEINTAMSQSLERSLPDGITERTRLFAKLQHWKTIVFDPHADLESEDTIVVIRPHVETLVSEESIQEFENAAVDIGQGASPSATSDQTEC